MFESKRGGKMLIPAVLVTEKAKKYGGVVQNLEGVGGVSGLRLWDGGAPADGYVYVGRALPGDVPGVLFQDQAGLSGFFNETLQLVGRLQMWSVQIELAARQGCDVQTLLDITEEAFRNPVLVADPSMKRIACTKNTPTRDRFFNEFRELGYPTPETYARLDKEHYYSPEYYSGRPVRMTTVEEPPVEVILQAIRINNKLIATAFMLLENTKYFPGLEYVFSHLVENIRKCLPEKEYAENSPNLKQYSFLLRDIIKGKKLSAAEIDARLQYSKYPNRMGFNTVVVSFTERRPSKLEYICRIFSELFLDSSPIVHDGCIVATISLGADKHACFSQNGGVLGCLSDYLANTGGICGISNCVENLASLKKGYEQAKSAIRLGTGLREKARWLAADSLSDACPNIYWYCDYAEYDVIYRAAAGGQSLRDLCWPALLELKRQDEQRQNENLRTLFVYLTNNQNFTDSAKALFIHRNSMIYRIERICELIGVQEISQALASRLLFSYKVLDVMSLTGESS